MAYEGPITKEALVCMEEIRKLEANMQFHHGEAASCIQIADEHAKLADAISTTASEHRKKLLESEEFLIQWKQKLIFELTTQDQLTLEKQPVPIELGRTE